MHYLKIRFYILIVCWPSGCWQTSSFWHVQKGFSISCYAFSKFFSQVFWPFFSWFFFIEYAKVGGSELVWAWLQLFEQYFLTSNSLLAFLFSHTVFWLYFFWLFKRYFMVYNVQDIVKLIFYGYSLTGGGTMKSKDEERNGETLGFRNDFEWKGHWIQGLFCNC